MKLKLKQLKQNSKGFTLVELLVSIALVSVVSVGVFGLLLSGSKSFNNISYSLRLQVESQLAMTQMKEYIIDADAGIAWDSGKTALYIVDKDEEKDEDAKTVTRYYLTVIRYYSGSIYLHFSPSVSKGEDLSVPTTESGSIASSSDWSLLTEHVTGLEFSFPLKEGAVVERPTELTMTLKMKRENKEYTGTQTIALRNAPYYNLYDLVG